MRIRGFGAWTRRPGSLAALIASAALLVAVALPVVANRPLMGDDLGRFHWPIRAFYARCLAQGDEPVWHPGIYCGFYIHGEGQAGMDHPMHRWLYASLPVDRAFSVEVIIGYPILFLGMVTWLRRRGMTPEAAILGGITFAFSGFLLLRYVHTNAVQVLAHLPWCLVAVDEIATGQTGRRSWLGPACLSLLIASQGLLGYPQYFGFSILATLTYGVWRLDGRGWLRFLAGLGLGLVGSCAQILPQLDALASSTRSRPTLEFLGKHSLHPVNLLQSLAPLAFRQGYYRADGPTSWPRHESVGYLGALVPALMAWLWIRRRSLGRHRVLVLWALAIGSTSLLLSLGRYSPLFPLYAKLPGAGVFRGPSRYFVIAQFAASVLVTVSFSDLVRVGRRVAQIPRPELGPLLWPVGGSLFAVSALAMASHYLPLGWRSEQIAASGSLAGSVAVVSIPCLLVTMAARGRRLAVAGLIVFAAIDSCLMSLLPISRHEFVPTESTQTDSPPGSGRVASPWNETLAHGGRLVEGYVALRPSRRLDYSRPEVLSLIGAEWRIQDGVAVHLETGPLPRAWLVSRVRLSDDPSRVLETLDPAMTAVVDEPFTLDTNASGTATIEEDRPGRMTIQVEASGRSLLVISEAYHPGWIAEIDGKAVRPRRVDGDLLGLLVDQGNHRVCFRFAPTSTFAGRVLSILAGFAAIGLLGFGLRPDVRGA